MIWSVVNTDLKPDADPNGCCGYHRMVKQNLGRLDRIFRFVIGVWWISPLAISFYTPWLNALVAIVGWWVLIESFIGFCPAHEWFGINNKNQ